MLVLRPEPGASATVKRARELGLEAIAVPLFETRSVDWTAPEPADFDGILLTSANAVRLAGDGLESLRGLRAYVVGDATAGAAREAGFDVAATGDTGVDRLLGSIEPDLKLLHLCGADRRTPTDPRQEITPLVVYEVVTIGHPELPDLADIVALLHSPRAARRFGELAKDRATVTIAAISDETGSAAGDGWATIATAKTPTDEALLALTATLCNKPHPK